MTKSCASGSTAFTPLDPADCGLYELEVENLLLSPVRFCEIGARSVSNWSALEDVPNTELAADLLRINRFTLVGEAVVRPITKLSTIREKSVVSNRW
jgi:hypothetical protein